ncbi:MAG TPA: ABC transporter substrate-binding protein, partial [Pseudothermotoga sp.]
MKKFLVFLILMVVVSIFSADLSMIISVTGAHQRNFNPYFAGGTGYAACGFIYETLVYSNNFTGDLIPWLASSYEWSQDYKSITLNIRKGVTWSDGKSFTADDVVFTFEMLKKFPALDTQGVWKSGLETVEKIDEYTVKLNFSKLNTLIIYNIAGIYIVPKHIWEKVEDPSKFTNENPVGTGAYVLETFTDQVFTLKKRADYWQADKIKVDRIRIPAFNGNEPAQLAVANGEIDWGGINYPKIENIQNKDIKFWFPEGNPVFLFFNLERAPFKDPAFRKAVAKAVNTDELIRIGMTNYAVKANPVVIKSGYSYLIDQNLKNKWYSFNLQQAKSELEALGFKAGKDGILVGPNGIRLSYELIVPAGWTDWIAVSQLLSQQLKKVGIELNVTPIDYGAYLTKIRQKDFDVAVSWSNYGPNPYTFFQNYLHSSNAYVGSNRGGWIDKYTDELTEKLSQTVDK